MHENVMAWTHFPHCWWNATFRCINFLACFFNTMLYIEYIYCKIWCNLQYLQSDRNFPTMLTGIRSVAVLIIHCAHCFAHHRLRLWHHKITMPPLSTKKNWKVRTGLSTFYVSLGFWVLLTNSHCPRIELCFSHHYLAGSIPEVCW